MMRKSILRAALASIALLFSALFASCEHKDLCYHHPHGQAIRLVFDWRYITQAPGAMRVFFYPEGDARRTAPYVFDISSVTRPEGTEIFLPRGTYRVVSFNLTTENVFYRGETSFADFEAYTQERAMVLRSAGGQGDVVTKTLALVETPDWMCRAHEEEVRIEPLPQGGTMRIVLTPRPAVSKFTCQIRGVKGLRHAQSVVGTLSGVAGTLSMGTGRLPETPSTVYFDVNADSDGVLTGDFLLFGLYPRTAGVANILTLYFKTEAGVSVVSFDVTDRVTVEEDQGQYVIKAHVQIEEEIELPSPIIHGEGGFLVGTEEWDAVHIDINVNI